MKPINIGYGKLRYFFHSMQRNRSFRVYAFPYSRGQSHISTKIQRFCDSLPELNEESKQTLIAVLDSCKDPLRFPMGFEEV